MTVLLLRLAAPLQSWGDSSRFVRRETRLEPTKSGVLGLIAAAQGRRRTDPVEDLVKLRFGVRVDQPGRLIRDFQTADHPITGKAMPLSYRYYLGDAAFLAAVEGDHALLDGIAEAIASPEFPLYLGRRSCPPSQPLVIGTEEGTIRETLEHAEWIAAEWHRRSIRSGHVTLDVFRDVLPDDLDDVAGETVRDEPISFSQERREYGWRTVVHEQVTKKNPTYHPQASARDDHDFMAAIGGF